MSAAKSKYLNGSSVAIMIAALASAGGAYAQSAGIATGEIETVVVTGTKFNPDVAPAKASLDAMEPQTIINQSYIQDSVAETSDYTTLLSIAPSMTGMDINGPGLSDGNVKNTLRGIPDGNFGLTYDGIPFGDTNGPTHHSESYFPASVIGSVVVDRSPGNAGNLGASTYGGSVNMFSEDLTDTQRIRASGTYGSWNTNDLNVNYQSGDFDVAGLGDNRLLANFEEIGSDGYLSYQSTAHTNVLLKFEHDIAPGWKITVFGNQNGLFQHLNDNNGETAAQVDAFGKQYALQVTNPALGNYVAYNNIHKNTDMDYVRLQGEAGWGITIDDTAYTYAYVNKTQTATDIEATATEITNGVTDGLGTVVGGTLTGGTTTGGVNSGGTLTGSTKSKTDVPGYSKLNAYRVWGNVFRFAKDFDYGWLTGQLRGGVWWEAQATDRSRFDYDMTKCVAQSTGCDLWDSGFNYTAIGDATNFSKGKADLVLPGALGAGPYAGYAEYLEHSGWDQYQPFAELELHPLPDLTITPGFKYIHWDHTTSSPVEPKNFTSDYSANFTTNRDLPFAMANYKILPNWSTYVQYAQGIYVPDVSVFEIKPAPANNGFPAAETTTNYQAGTVYYGDNFNVDADVYYIGVNNNYVSEPCNQPPFNGPAGETCYANTGAATYKGVEGEGTYSLEGIVDGLAVFANGSVMSSKTQGFWVAQAPMWTAASGLFYKFDAIKLSLTDKLVGPQFNNVIFNSNNTLNVAATQFYKLHTYNVMDFKGGYAFGNMEFDIGIYNVLNSRAITQEKGTDMIGGASVYDIANRGGSLDQYYFQPSRSAQFTLKATF
jgi:iron complex outermembrane recepter protein